MNKQSFSIFDEASSFARSKAKELGRTVKMVRDGNNFVVIYDDWRERHLQEESKKEEREQKQRELEQKRIQTEAAEQAERKTFLDDRKKYFESLTDKELDDLWANRENFDMEKDEIFVLRSVVRERKGIKPISDVRANMTFCPTCLFPVDNCTCDRSWW